MKKYYLKLIFLLSFLISDLAICQIVEPLYPFGTNELQKAQVYFDKGLLRKAQEQILLTLKNFPETPAIDRTLLLQAQIELQSGNYIAAEQKYFQYLKDYPNSPLIPQIAMLRANLAFELKKYGKADTLFAQAKLLAEQEFATRKDSVYYFNAHDALYWRGISLSLLGNYQEAQRVFEECFTKYPDGKFADDALFCLGMNAELNNQFDNAIDYFKTLGKRYPKSNTFIASKVREVNNYIILRDPNLALFTLETTELTYNRILAKDTIGITYEPQSYTENVKEEMMYLRGEANNLNLNYDKSLAIFQVFLSTYKNSELINYARLSAGWAALNKANYDEALTHYDSIIASPREEDSRLKATAQLYRTTALKQKGMIEQAQKELSSLSVQPGFPYTGAVLLELGQIYYENENYENANRTLERALREASNAVTKVRTHLLLGATNIQLKRWNKAYSEYKNAEQTALKSSELYMPQKNLFISEARLNQGIALVLNSRSSEAITPLLAFSGTSKNDPRTEDAMFWLAEAYFRSDLLNNAKETYINLLNLYPNTKFKEEAYYGLGWSYFRLKDFTKSSATFDKMIEEYPGTKYAVEVLVRLADGFYVVRNYRKAAETYKRVLKLSPASDEGQYSAYQMCNALYRLGSMEEAVNSLMNFVKSYPNSQYAPHTLYLMGWIRFQQKNYAEAIDNFKFLLNAYPQSTLVARTYYAMGDAYYNIGNYEVALEAYKTVVELYPNSPLAAESIKSMQYCYLALGRNDEAITLADSYIESNPNSPFAEEFKFKKGEMFYTGKNFKDAIVEYENFMKKYPDSEKSAEAMYWMGKSYVNLNELDKASKTFNEVQNKYKKSDFAPLAMLENGLLQKQMNNTKTADSLFRIIQELYPDNQVTSQAGYERGIMKFLIGDTLQAISIFRNVADKYPSLEFGLQSRYKIAMYYRMSNKNDSAIANFKILATRFENPMLAAESQYRIGEIIFRQNEFEKALVEFMVVREKFAGFEDWFSLSILSAGECYEKLNKFTEAVDVYKALLSIRLDDEFSQTAKRRITELESKIKELEKN